MPLMASFSVEAYDKARARLKELACRKGGSPYSSQDAGESGQPFSDDEKEEAKPIESRQRVRSVHRDGEEQEEQPLPSARRQERRQQQQLAPSRGRGESTTQPEAVSTMMMPSLSEEDLDATVGREVEAMEKELVQVMRAAGLRQARESVMLGLAARLQKGRKDWVDALEDRVDKWRSLARSLRRKYDQREEKVEEELASIRAETEKELQVHEQRSKRLFREAESKRAAEAKALREQHEEELRTQAVAREKEQEEWRKAALKDMEDKMVADLDKTKSRIKKEGKAQIDQVIARLESEYRSSLEVHEVKLREARRKDEAQTHTIEELSQQNEELVQEVESLRQARTELEATAGGLREKLAKEQKAQAATSQRIQELQETFEKLVGSLKKEVMDLEEAHATEMAHRDKQRDAELEDLDARIRKSLAAKDQVIAKLKVEVAEANKEAATARVLLKDLYDGFRPMEPITPP